MSLRATWDWEPSAADPVFYRALSDVWSFLSTTIAVSTPKHPLGVDLQLRKSKLSAYPHTLNLLRGLRSQVLILRPTDSPRRSSHPLEAGAIVRIVGSPRCKLSPSLIPITSNRRSGVNSDQGLDRDWLRGLDRHRKVRKLKRPMKLNRLQVKLYLQLTNTKRGLARTSAHSQKKKRRKSASPDPRQGKAPAHRGWTNSWVSIRGL